MATGLSGDTEADIGGDPTADLSLIEQRVTNNLLQSLLGTNQAMDQLGRLRDDQAFQLQIPTPLPGAGR